MVTEKGSIINRTVLSEKVQKQNSRTLFIVSLICLIVGAIGLAAYIGVSTYLETVYEDAPAWCDALLVFAVPFAFGLIFLLTIHSLVKQARKNSGVINEYEFFADCIMAREIRGEETTANVRMEYAQILKTKEKGDYLFFYYQVKQFLYPVEKATLSTDELNTVKKLMRAPVPAGAKILELPDLEISSK